MGNETRRETDTIRMTRAELEALPGRDDVRWREPSGAEWLVADFRGDAAGPLPVRWRPVVLVDEPQAARQETAEGVRERIRQALVNADSYVSWCRHRHPNADDRQRELDDAVREFRALQRELPALLAPPAAMERRETAEGVREALAEAIERSIRTPNDRFAYHECLQCGQTWWGEREGRDNPERERHRRDCPVLRWRAALLAPPAAEGTLPKAVTDALDGLDHMARYGPDEGDPPPDEVVDECRRVIEVYTARLRTVAPPQESGCLPVQAECGDVVLVRDEYWCSEHGVALVDDGYSWSCPIGDREPQESGREDDVDEFRRRIDDARKRGGPVCLTQRLAERLEERLAQPEGQDEGVPVVEWRDPDTGLGSSAREIIESVLDGFGWDGWTAADLGHLQDALARAVEAGATAVLRRALAEREGGKDA